MMPSILRHSILSARRSSSSGRATLRLNRHYSAAAAVSISSSSNNSGASSAAGIQTYSRQRIYAPPPYRSYYASGISSIRSMVTVTQTSASEKSTPPQALNNNNSSTATSSSSETLSNVEDNGGLNITSSCASRIRQLASSRPNPEQVYLRLYVDAGGCSGFQYKFLLLSQDNNDNDDDEEDGTIDPEEDIIFIKDGMRVVVDQTSLDLLRGSTIDYVQEMIRSSFAVVGNPQSESACGCGSSFAVKNFEANPALD